MTGAKLYEKYSYSLYEERQQRWIQSELRYERTWPVNPPVAWPFLSDHEKRVWANLARKITPRKERA